MEYTFVMIRPGALRRKQAIKIMNQIRENDLTIEYRELKQLDEQFINEHYAHLLCNELPRDIFDRTMVENLSGEVIGMIVSGENAVAKMRTLIGPSNVRRAKEEFPNCIRAMGDPNNNPDNLIHASDSIENAIDEIRRFFNLDIIEKIKILNKNL